MCHTLQWNPGVTDSSKQEMKAGWIGFLLAEGKVETVVNQGSQILARKVSI